jgi:hypothetical protein
VWGRGSMAGIYVWSGSHEARRRKPQVDLRSLEIAFFYTEYR